MKTSSRGVKAIAAHEGFRAKAYPDPGSSNGLPWTIGYGHTRGVKRGDVTTKEQALRWLHEDISWAEDAVTSLKADLTQNQFDALVSFAFNVGASAFKSSSPARYAKSGRHELVPARLMLWVKNDGKTMQGLVNRRAAEGKMYADAEPRSSQNMRAAPIQGKTATESKTAVTAVTQGLGATTVAVTYAADIKDNLTRMTEGLSFNATPLLIGGMAVAGILTACWFYYDRMHKSKEDGV